MTGTRDIDVAVVARRDDRVQVSSDLAPIERTH